MLSVQNLGCAGMERLGIPASTTMGAPLSSQRDDRSVNQYPQPLNPLQVIVDLIFVFIFYCRSIRRSTFPIQHDLIISANRQTQNLLDESKTEPKSGIKSEAFQSYERCNQFTSCSSKNNCPTHVPRHDGEFGRDRYLNSFSQVSPQAILFMMFSVADQ